MNPHSISRRSFLAAGAAVTLAAATSEGEWGSTVIDIHTHLRADTAANLVHMDGAGEKKAVLLTRAQQSEQAREAVSKMPERFVWSVATDVSKAEAEPIIRQAVISGAKGIGELKSHLQADGPEMMRAYAWAGDLGVPILIHFQEVDHFAGEGAWNSGFKRFAKVLEKFPKTTFVGHADAFWANVSADYHEEAAYPDTPIKPGGLTDKLLSEYPNLFGDMSANSGNNALSRSPEFTHEFLKRHQEKLMFGSDCSCTDGHGGGISQQNNPTAARMSGKCVARETLALLKGQTTPELFRKLTWTNAHRVYKIA